MAVLVYLFTVKKFLEILISSVRLVSWQFFSYEILRAEVEHRSIFSASRTLCLVIAPIAGWS